MDENGLWAIMAMRENNNILVLKVPANKISVSNPYHFVKDPDLETDQCIRCFIIGSGSGLRGVLKCSIIFFLSNNAPSTVTVCYE